MKYLMEHLLFACCIAALTWGVEAAGEEFSVDSSQGMNNENPAGAAGNRGERYTLFNRTPADQLRPLAPEPHPYTTDPGWWIVEFEKVNFTYSRGRDENYDRVRTRTFTWPVMVKVGLTERLDLQVSLDAYEWEKERVSPRRELPGFLQGTGLGKALGGYYENLVGRSRERAHGVGSLSLRSKYNFWGNDEEGSAAAIMPFVTFPPFDSRFGPRRMEAGAKLPTLWPMGEHWEFETTPALAAVRNSADDGYELGFDTTSVLSRDVGGGWSVFSQFETSLTTEDASDWEGTLFGGVTWDISDYTVLELAVGRGVTSAAEDYTGYLSLVQRF